MNLFCSHPMIAGSIIVKTITLHAPNTGTTRLPNKPSYMLLKICTFKLKHVMDNWKGNLKKNGFLGTLGTRFVQLCL